jgi:hypothetical protein
MVEQENVIEIQAFRAVMRHEIDQSSRVTGPAMLVDAVHKCLPAVCTNPPR